MQWLKRQLRRWQQRYQPAPLDQQRNHWGYPLPPERHPDHDLAVADGVDNLRD